MPDSETKVCQNCKTSFVIDASDFDFYTKIKVPAPTFCPRCRLQRRLAFFNIFNLYKRQCDLCKKDFISMYRPDAPYVIYCPRCWWGDNWDAFEHGRDYDFSRPFFEQLKELWRTTPLLGISIGVSAMETSPYTNHASDLKNCYLLFNADHSEDCAYGFYMVDDKTLLDCSNLFFCELSYDLFHAYKSSASIGSFSLTESINCFFLRDSENCQNCFASANLRNKKYHIFNKPYSKEDYFTEIKKWDFGSYKTYKQVKGLAKEHWKKFPPYPLYQKFTVNSSGNHVYETKNCRESFEVAGAEDSKYLMMINDRVKDSYDVSSWGGNMSRSYECSVVGEDVADIRFTNESGVGLIDAEYCKLSTGGKRHFGCVSVKKGDYVIFNKKYPENEYRELREKIITHMNEMPYVSRRGNGNENGNNGRQIAYKYGEFFPAEMSPFAYNETIANNFFPLSKQETIAAGWRWHEPELHDYSITKYPKDLPDHIKDAGDNILKEVIACAKCGRGFRIIRMELDFLRRMNLPLPRECPFCRIGEKFDAWVKESKLIKRVCDKCGTEFETPHTKDDFPKILCKECWWKEVV